MSALFLALFNRAVAAGWLVLAVLVLRLVLKKAPKWVNCLLWALVAVRLVWPFSIQSGLSLLPSAEVLPPEMLFSRSPELRTGLEFVNAAVNPSFTGTMTPVPGASVNPLQVWTWLAGWGWLLGAVILALYAAVSWLRLKQRVAASVEQEGVWLCDGIGSPFILGLFRPRIYVPSGLEGRSLAHVLAHEQAHLARKDHWWKPLGYGLLTVFWFHPLLWLAYFLLCRDIELACDERVVKTMALEEKKAYSQALLDCASGLRSMAACPLAFGEVGVRQRIRSVLRYQKPAFWMVVLAVVLCLAAAVCFLTNPLGFRPDFQRADMAQAVTMDLRLNAGPLTQTLTPQELDELWERLRDLKYTRRDDVYGGFTPFYSLSLQLQDGQWLRIQGYALDGSMTDLVYGEDVYQVKDQDFQAYLDRICAGGVRTQAPAASPAAGTVFVSDQCLYLNPLSSALATGDTGYTYTVEADAFVLTHRATGETQPIGPIAWQWQEFPFTDEEWADLFLIAPVDVSGYTQRLYQPLDGERYLLSMDGQLWLVVDHGDSRTGIWSIHTLTPE